MKWTEKINFKNKNLNFFSFDFFNPTLKFFFLPYFLSSKSNRKHVFKKRKSYVTRISQELPLFNFERLDILCAWIGSPSENLWPFEFLESLCCSISSVSIYYAHKSDLWVKGYDHLNFSRAFVVQYRVSRYIMRLNRTSEWKVMTCIKT